MPYTNDPIAIDLNNDGQSEVTIVGITTTNTSGVYSAIVQMTETFSKKDLSDQIAPLKYSSFDLGDVDNDLDIDFLLTGFDETSGLKSYLYENTTDLGGDYELTETSNNLVAIRDGTVDFIDFDSDGDLDADLVIKALGFNPEDLPKLWDTRKD